MPKIKTRKTILKRFKISKTGKVFRGHQYAGHRKSHKSKRRILTYKKSVQLAYKQAKSIKRMINV